MCTIEGVKRIVKSKGPSYLLERIFSGELPNSYLEDLENMGILRKGVPCISLIYSFTV